MSELVILTVSYMLAQSRVIMCLSVCHTPLLCVKMAESSITQRMRHYQRSQQSQRNSSRSTQAGVPNAGGVG